MVIEAGAGVQTGGIIEQIQQDLFVGGLGQGGGGACIVLPERAVVTGLPAFDQFADGFEAGIGCQAIWDGPAANAGAVGFEVEAAMQFAGGSAVGGRPVGFKEFGEQRGDFWRPRRTVVAPGTARGPSVGLSLGAGPQILAVEFVEAWTGQSQFLRGGEGLEFFPLRWLARRWRTKGAGRRLISCNFSSCQDVRVRGILRFGTDTGGG